MVDLNAFLPAGFTDAEASGIDAATGGIVGTALAPGTEHVSHAILWEPLAAAAVPEPGALTVVGMGLVGLIVACLRRRHAEGA